MADLTLPGSIPGLLRRGSPIRTVLESPGVVVAITTPVSLLVAVGTTVSTYTARSVRLDLADPTGRVHACWWWRAARVPREHVSWPHVSPEMGGSYSAAGFRDHPDFSGTLEGLDLADPRTLPDGSRWVDAESLRRVVLHVAGLEVSP